MKSANRALQGRRIAERHAGRPEGRPQQRQAGLFTRENQQPYCLYWDGQLYRSYAEEWKEPVTEDALIGKTDALCPGSRIPDAHGEANCLLEGTVIARAEDKLLAQVDDGWWIFSPVK